MYIFENDNNNITINHFSKEYFLPLDLQLFAKEGPGGEKTEQATDKKLSDARKEGQVAKSHDLTQAVSLMAFFIALKIWVGYVGSGFVNIFSGIYSRIGEMITLVGGEISIKDFSSLINFVLVRILLILLPFFATAVIVAFVMDLIQVKWKPTSKPLQPKFSKLNPIKGFSKVFSKSKIVELLKSLAKIFLIGYIAITTVRDQFGVLFKFPDLALRNSIGLIGDIAISMGIKMSALYLVIGLIDYGYQKWKFNEDMKMTKQEVKDEFKNAEGDPAIKGKQRQRMQEASRRRMMQSVPQADVVITNPTHFAVAVKYDPDVFDAPFVVAKGEDFLAAKIKEKAREAGVEIVENKPLARMLYYNVDLGMPIPPELYQTVAEILAVIYNQRKIS